MLNFLIFALLFDAPPKVRQQKNIHEILNFVSNNNNMSGPELLACHCLFDDSSNKDEDKPGLGLENRMCQSQRHPRISLKKCSQSAFCHRHDSGNNQALIDCCAVDHKVFGELLQLFKSVFDDHGVDQLTGLTKKLKPSQTRRG